MYTNENYRGQGIATKLLTKLVDEAKISGISQIWLGASKWVDQCIRSLVLWKLMTF